MGEKSAAEALSQQQSLAEIIHPTHSADGLSIRLAYLRNLTVPLPLGIIKGFITLFLQ